MKYIVEVDLLARRAYVQSMGTPNVFAWYEGSLDQCRAIADLLNERMARMEKTDRIIPAIEEEIEAAAGCRIENGVCLEQ